MSKRKILVTSALPYANAGCIWVTCWNRFRPISGCASRRCAATNAIRLRDDTHGAPIMLAAEKQGITRNSWWTACANCTWRIPRAS